MWHDFLAQSSLVDTIVWDFLIDLRSLEHCEGTVSKTLQIFRFCPKYILEDANDDGHRIFSIGDLNTSCGKVSRISVKRRGNCVLNEKNFLKHV